MCLLNEISQFNSVKTMVNVEVGVPAEVAWKTDSLDGALHLTEGEEREIVCKATDGYPRMDFGWTSYKVDGGRSNREFQSVAAMDSDASIITNRTGTVGNFMF